MKEELKYEDIIWEQMTETIEFLKSFFTGSVYLFLIMGKSGNLNGKNNLYVFPLANQYISPTEMPQC